MLKVSVVQQGVDIQLTVLTPTSNDEKQSNSVNNNLPFDKKSPLTFKKKVYEFYTAPITKFWMDTVRE